MSSVSKQDLLRNQPKPRYGVVENFAARALWSLNQLFEDKSSHRDQSYAPIQASIAFPQARKALERELHLAEPLGKTVDGKHIYLCHPGAGSSIIRELGRLREIAFRCVGEGTLRHADIDQYDHNYSHIVLWDARQLEIVGAYRVGEAYNLVSRFGKSALYTNELFHYTLGFEPYFSAGIELGRSFIQPQYWGKRSLDYLWQGIGAYLQRRPQVKYVFGAVSISNNYPEIAKQEISACYRYNFSGPASGLAKARFPYYCERSMLESFRGLSLEESMQQLHLSLKRQNLDIPPLLKHYSDFCEPRGTHLLDFNLDPKFNHCIDALMLIELDRVKPKKLARYLSPSFNPSSTAPSKP